MQPLKISEKLTIELYRNTGDVVNQVRCSYLCFVQTIMAIKTVHSRINSNHLRKPKIIALEIKINAQSVFHMLRNYSGVCAYKR